MRAKGAKFARFDAAKVAAQAEANMSALRTLRDDVRGRRRATSCKVRAS
jgi:hypothetical protein